MITYYRIVVALQINLENILKALHTRNWLQVNILCRARNIE